MTFWIGGVAVATLELQNAMRLSSEASLVNLILVPEPSSATLQVVTLIVLAGLTERRRSTASI